MSPKDQGISKSHSNTSWTLLKGHLVIKILKYEYKSFIPFDRFYYM